MRKKRKARTDIYVAEQPHTTLTKSQKFTTTLTSKKKNPDYLYTFNYDYHHSDLCKLESRQVFGEEEMNKLLFSNLEIDPSISPFIKNRLELISSSADYSEFLQNIEDKNIHIEGFKIEYLIWENDVTDFAERREKMKDIGYRIEGNPNFDTPSITYAVCKIENIWYFGVLAKQDVGWYHHKQKPCSFSNSIGMTIGKSLVGIASKGDKSNRLLDACCGVGTILLEACFAGFSIEGCDINPNACKHTEANLAYYSYSANVYCSDIKELGKSLDKQYDAVIIDLPYNLYSYSNDEIVLNIIESTAKLAPRIVIVSISDIENLIKKAGLEISDFGTVEKRGKSKFTRKIWVCEVDNN
ncbi:MAG: tRNA G10 N-methylase Trm11 [Flammeovirgaceae bacterium]|jgi:tRNA G10  N-methylase Trm11